MGALAASVTHDTDVDFTPNGTGGLLNGVEIVGTGPAAYIAILKDWTNWVQMSPANAPSQREGFGLVYDAVNDELVLFGGFDGTSYLNDTWRYDYANDTWIEVSPTVSPPVRSAQGMVYDSTHKAVVVYGGYGPAARSDTWEFYVTNDTWMEVFPTASPGNFADYPMAYDSGNDRSILAGVSFTSGTMETWAYDAGAHSWSQRAPPTSPSVRSMHRLAYYASRGVTVLYGGGQFPAVYDDTWEYSYAADSWVLTSSSGPGGRLNYAWTYRSLNNDILLFGGSDGTNNLAGSWRYNYDVGFPQWAQVNPPSEPSARSAHGMAYDTSDTTALLFGGLTGTGRVNDTWAFTEGYRPGGFYRSNRIDSGDANTVWGQVFWNDTTQPPGTQLRLQISIGNVANPSSYNFLGPLCTSTDYYTVSPSTICPSQSGRYLWYFAQLISSNPANTPVLDNITFTYTVPNLPPSVVDHYPAHVQGSIPLTAPIWVNFSEAMNTSSVTVEVDDPAISFSYSWSNGNTTLKATHATPYSECRAYWAWVNGTDPDGNPLPGNSIPDKTKWVFFPTCTPPEIVSTDPMNQSMNVPLTKPIVVTFSEAMDTTTLTWNITPFIPLTDTWSAGDTVATLSHTIDFQSCTWYTVEITGGKDLSGQNLIPNPTPNPWSFKTDCPEPYVVLTDPSPDQIFVPQNTPIVITFSEPMNTGTVYVNATPPLSGRNDVWSGGNSILTLNHAGLAFCTLYNVIVTYGEDVGGTPMKGPYEWNFTTDCNGPFILSTYPANGDVGIDPLQSIYINFTESMNTGSVVVTITSNPQTTPIWTSLDTRLQLVLIDALPDCTLITVSVSGSDAQGRPLQDPWNKNPFQFTTICIRPKVITTDPFAGEFDVDLLRIVNITFDKAMDPATVVVTLTPSVPLIYTWSFGFTVLEASHNANPFVGCSAYTAQVTGQDTSGQSLQPGPVPNPWNFTTICPQPFVVSTDPFNNETGVDIARNIVVAFSKPMNTTTFQLNCSPANFTITGEVWSAGNSTVTVTHTPFSAPTNYTCTVQANDTFGNPLIPGPVPNPWNFATTPPVPPVIVTTDPFDGETGVLPTRDIVVTFSKAMNTSTFQLNCVPAITITGVVWSGGDTIVTVSHTPFSAPTNYTCTVQANDTVGLPLDPGPVPNPWSFATVQTPPFIVTTDPFDGETGVEVTRVIVASFSKAMDPASFQLNCVPAITITGVVWSGGNSVVNVSHADFTPATTYTCTIQANDASGNPLVPGPVPNPWSFTTTTIPAPGAPPGLSVERANPDVIVKWQAATGATSYRVYRSNDRLAPLNTWTVVNVTVLSWTHANAYLDGLTWYYVVRGVNGAGEGMNSTMGVKLDKAFGTPGPGSRNIYWMSLPYNSIYGKASDVTSELTSAKIDMIGKWDAASQSSIVYFFRGGLWRGTDFAISAGDGIFVNTVTPFSWVINGTDSAVALSFTLSAAGGNINRISLPYTNSYATASDVVAAIEANPSAPTKIVALGLWDPVNRMDIRWFWDGTNWVGTDFNINPGDGFYLEVISSFVWTPDLVTPEQP